MTEAEWREAQDPHSMRRLLQGASQRDLMFFAYSCCDRIRGLIRDRRSLEALAVLQRVIEGQAQRDELESAAEEAQQAVWVAVRAVCVSQLGEAEYEQQLRIARTGPDPFEQMASADPDYLAASAVLCAVRCTSDPSSADVASRFAAAAVAATARGREWVSQAALLRHHVVAPPESSAPQAAEPGAAADGGA